MKIVDGGYWFGRYWVQIDTGTAAEWDVIWFDDAWSALEWIGGL